MLDGDKAYRAEGAKPEQEVRGGRLRRNYSDSENGLIRSKEEEGLGIIGQEEEEESPPSTPKKKADSAPLPVSEQKRARRKVEDPTTYPFIPFDDLEFSYVAGSVTVCRPIPDEFAKMYRSTLEMITPVVQRITKIRKIFTGNKAREVILVDRALTQRVDRLTQAPIEDLRLADQMLCLALVGHPRTYSYWYLQYYIARDVGKILGRGEFGELLSGDEENEAILKKIENMTGTRIIVAPFDVYSWRRSFILMGEEELINRALPLLSGAIQQKVAPQDVSQMGVMEGEAEQDERIEEIGKELQEKYSLRMIEVERDGNCLFRALSLYEWGTEDRHGEMRAGIVARLQDMAEAVELVAMVDNKTPAEYIKGMEENGQWGGHTEVMAFSECFHRNVRMFVENPRIGLRPTDLDVGTDGEKAQLLLYKSHYWLLQ